MALCLCLCVVCVCGVRVLLQCYHGVRRCWVAMVSSPVLEGSSKLVGVDGKLQSEARDVIERHNSGVLSEHIATL